MENIKMPKFVYVGLFFIAVLPYLYLNGALQTAIDISLGSFSGVLQKVDTGCFSDGECAADISGKHVILLVGWSKDQVGQIIGADSVGGLSNHIGEKVSVYAKRVSFSKFTLVGSQKYYIKIMPKESLF